MKPAPVPPHIAAIERPRASLMTYYLLQAFASLPLIFVTLPMLYFRYHTMRYRIDADGIHMAWGIIFRREVMLNYSRIQDIHLKSGLLQRWLGLANVEVQTASGSATAEVVIEGFKEFDAIRDFLYTRMRGYQAKKTAAATPKGANVPGDEAVPLLLSIRDELRRTRELLESRKPNV